MKSIIYCCPTGDNKPSGGIKVIYRHVEILSNKIDAKIFHYQDPNFKCGWFNHNVKFKKDSTFDSNKEFVIIPEWMAVYLAQILQKLNVKYGIFVQGGFTLNTRPKYNFTDQDIKKAYEKAEIIISSSDEISECIKLTFPTVTEKIFQINISVDNKKFNISEEDFKNKENLITYMPRKKLNHAKKLIFILEQHLSNKWKIESLDNLTELELIKYLQKSKIFLSFSELEGLGLPPVESGLCGNYVIGYTGEGGKEYWNPPIFDIVSSGDIRTFANKVINKVKDLDKNNYAFVTLKSAINKLADKYSTKNEENGLLSLIDKMTV